MDDPHDVGQCARCGRWQRRRHAYVEVFGPGDREEWCVTGGCFATWADGVDVALRARHDDGATPCLCASCRAPAVGDAATDADVIAWAADHGVVGPLDGLDVRSARGARA